MRVGEGKGRKTHQRRMKLDCSYHETHRHQLHDLALVAKLFQRLAAVGVVCHVLAAVVERNLDNLRRK